MENPSERWVFMTIRELWEPFAYHCRVSRRSSSTIRFYDSGVKSLELYFAASECSNDVCDLTVHDLRSYLLWLEGEGVGPGGIHAYGRAVRAIFNWAIQEEMLTNNPVSRLKLPSLPKHRLPSIEPATVQKLLHVAKQGSQPYRDTAIIMALFDSGVRVGELVSIQTAHLSFEKGYFRVLGKGNRERTVPVGTRTILAINQYQRRERKPATAEIPKLFLNRLGQPLTVFGVGQRLDDLAKEAGIEREACSPHTFRRGFAVQFLRNGGNVFELQQILGHSTLEMTRRYVSFLDEDLKTAHLRFSPGDRL
jgi:integrase/recombinase XerD